MRLPDFDTTEDPEDQKGDTSFDISSVLRKTWIEEVRKYHQRTTGKVSSYTPGPRLDGGRDSHGTTFKAVWPKLAKFCVVNKLDPSTFVKAQFSNCAGRPPLSPSMLVGSEAVKRYQHFVASKESNKSVSLARDIQIRQAKDALEYYRRLYTSEAHVYKAMLLDDNLTLSALFRYCLAVQVRDTSLAQILLIPAAKQYSEDPAGYSQAYPDWIDGELINAAKIYSSVAGDNQ